MSDISKCNGIDCSLRETCYRFTSDKSDVWQSYINHKQDEDGKCEFYIDEN